MTDAYAWKMKICNIILKLRVEWKDEKGGEVLGYNTMDEYLIIH